VSDLKKNQEHNWQEKKEKLVGIEKHFRSLGIGSSGFSGCDYDGYNPDRKAALVSHHRL
jgi:hypothetical protein